MRILLEWLKPGVKVKRYIILQLISLGTLAYSVATLITRDNMSFKTLVSYIALITIALFLTVYSFILAQRSVLMATLKGLAYAVIAGIAILPYSALILELTWSNALTYFILGAVAGILFNYVQFLFEQYIFRNSNNELYD